MLISIVHLYRVTWSKCIFTCHLSDVVEICSQKGGLLQNPSKNILKITVNHLLSTTQLLPQRNRDQRNRMPHGREGGPRLRLRTGEPWRAGAAEDGSEKTGDFCWLKWLGDFET